MDDRTEQCESFRLVPPATGPDAGTLDAWRQYALAFLHEHLAAQAPASLGEPVLLAESPLEGEGPLAVFAFDAAPGGGEPQAFYVVVGRTEPNYYPAWSLTPDEAFSLHLGTRFMLTVPVSQAPAEESAAWDPRADVERLVAQVAPREPIGDLAVSALFVVGDQRHAVCRCRVGGDDVYVMARDCPPGFYRLTHLAPHVVYRLHLGNVIRQEPPPDESNDG